MRVLFQTRFNAFDRKGGDTVQLLKTKQALEKRYGDSVQIDINNDPETDLSEYDIIHVFNILRPQETYLFVKNALKQNKPIALSTIYWKSMEFETQGQFGIRKFINRIVGYGSLERIRLVYRYFFDNEKHDGTKAVIKMGFENAQSYILDNCDILFPNGYGEIELLRKELKRTISNFIVVPNAIETDESFEISSSEKKDVVCVGRIEPRKNQLGLVRALSNTPFDVYIIGKVNDTQKKYFELVKKNAGPNIHFVTELNEKDLIEVYKKAKVHVLPSWYDTPGLVSLEAGYYGCNLVVGIEGTTKEYFQGYASYVHPLDINSIRKEVINSYHKESNVDLSNYIKENYTWEKAAEKTFEGYNKILAKE